MFKVTFLLFVSFFLLCVFLASFFFYILSTEGHVFDRKPSFLELVGFPVLHTAASLSVF